MRTLTVSLVRLVAMMTLCCAVLIPVQGFATVLDDTHAGRMVKDFSLAGTPADCSTNSPGIGTSLAVVQGSKVNRPEHPVLVVTSCLASGGGKAATEKRASLYFTNPATGALVTTFRTVTGTTVTAPGTGWAGLALAADKGVLFGCSDNGSLFTIDYNALNNVPDGTMTPMKKPTLATSCTGLAWDPSDGTIYQAAGNTIFHFDPDPAGTGAAIATYGAPASCTVKGLSVTGGVLAIACANNTVQRVPKLTGPIPSPLPDHTTFSTSGVGVPSDLECDPVTFSSTNIDAFWTKVSATQRIQAFRVPGGTCGLPPAATVFAPAACPDLPVGTVPYRRPVASVPSLASAATDGAPLDDDGDGLWNCWEDPARWSDAKPGIDFNAVTSSPNRDLVLCAMVDTTGDGVADVQECADPKVKDVFVEIDFMENADGSSSHRPDPQALLLVRQAFANAPVNNPSATTPTGIRLHAQVDDRIPHTRFLALEPCTQPASAAGSPDVSDFDSDIKATYFGTGAAEKASANARHAKSFAFRYAVFGHELVGTTASGCSELPGNDFAVTLGRFGVADASGHKRGTTDQQAGTFMHEVGHALGLRHGGGDNVNCKPNYLSVMSYSRQFSDFVTGRPLDYSRAAIPSPTSLLNESALNEISGLGLSASLTGKTVHSVPTALTPWVVNAGGSINWNGSASGVDATNTTADINKLTAAGCDGAGDTLNGFNDWTNLVYNLRATIEFVSGRETENISSSPDDTEKTAEEEAASFAHADHDSDGIADAFACRQSITTATFVPPLPNPLPEPLVLPCIIDIKPGEKPNIISKGSTSNIQVAIKATADFDPVTQLARETLTLNGVPVRLNQQGSGTCSTPPGASGRSDLVCQFPYTAMLNQVGTNYSILEGIAHVIVNGTSQPTGIRARDVVTVK